MHVNQTTVARRLNRLEHDLNTRLFERIDGLFHPTLAGETAIKQAEDVEATTNSLLSELAGQNDRPSGTIRLASVPGFFIDYLLPRLPDFYAAYPNIKIELVGSNNNLNLLQREADIAIRLARPDPKMKTSNLKAKRLAYFTFGLYIAPALIQNSKTIALHNLPIVSYDETMAHLPEAQWLSQYINSENITLSTNDLPTLRTAILNGIGAGLLPEYAGMNIMTDSLIKLPEPSPMPQREIWLLIHSELQALSRYRSFIDWLTKQFHESERSSLDTEYDIASEDRPYDMMMDVWGNIIPPEK
jgi:DNA-binding transcriptional LysR family regulator